MINRCVVGCINNFLVTRRTETTWKHCTHLHFRIFWVCVAKSLVTLYFIDWLILEWDLVSYNANISYCYLFCFGHFNPSCFWVLCLFADSSNKVVTRLLVLGVIFCDTVFYIWKLNCLFASKCFCRFGIHVSAKVEKQSMSV